MCCKRNDAGALEAPCVETAPRYRFTRSQDSKRRGFSLVELMVVIVIIGLLAGAITVSVRSYMVRARQNLAKSEIQNIANALELYYSLEKGYPTPEQGLEVLIRPSPNMVDGYLKGRKLNDPWGNPYRYFVPGPDREPYEVVSFGADNLEGGTGENTDISSADLKGD